MKTYNILYAFLACAILSCSKSDTNTDVEGEGGDTPGADASYNLLVNDNSVISSTLINATAEVLTLNPAKSSFEDMIMPDLVYNDGSIMTSYQKNTDCGGIISQFNFSDNSTTTLDLFAELSDCNLKVTAIAHSDSKLYLTYHLDDSNDYFVRVIDLSQMASNFVDVPLKNESFDPTYIPKELVFANGKLFILGHDESATDEYHLLIMSESTNTLMSDVNLGFDVKQIFKNPAENIIVSYSNLHSEINSSTLKVKYTNYNDSTAPNFVNSKYNYFDSQGRMYYEMPPGDYSSYAIIPAVYDFDNQLAILYAYENFLTEAQSIFEFKIENTTMVSYDDKNDFIVIGYKKMESSNKGGILRIKPAPAPELIDNLDVDGIPYKLYVK
ncbi:hypothetical protein [Aurantibacter sp.]|uniref:hypothetical protein n=1 Tax=Aurantibacter sp. TaxID=2807103 RepID=UPI00326773CD